MADKGVSVAPGNQHLPRLVSFPVQFALIACVCSCVLPFYGTESLSRFLDAKSSAGSLAASTHALALAAHVVLTADRAGCMLS